MSHTIRGLESRLGIRLLTRTTRGVSCRQPRLENACWPIGPYHDGIETELEALNAMREKAAGTIRLTAKEYSTSTVLWPKLAKLLPDYPDINVEISINYSLVDIVTERYDAGVRVGDLVAMDMVAMRISPDLRMAVVASPSYAARRGLPETLEQSTAHDCINLPLPTHGGLLPWEFSKDGQSLEVNVQGRLVFNSIIPIRGASLAGFGLAHVPEGLVREDLIAGRLVPVLERYWPILPGYHLYYPSRRQASPAFALLLNALRQPLAGPDESPRLFQACPSRR